MNFKKTIVSPLWGTVHRKTYYKIGRLEVIFSRCIKKSQMGPLGGGWRWKLGVQVGSSCFHLDLITISVRVSIK